MASERSALNGARNCLIAIGMFASLAVTALSGGNAEARVPDGDRVSETAVRCGYIQDNFDHAQELGSQALITYWINQWYSSGCHDYYGPISVRVVTNDTGVVTGVDTVSPGGPSGGSPAVNKARVSAVKLGPN